MEWGGGKSYVTRGGERGRDRSGGRARERWERARREGGYGEREGSGGERYVWTRIRTHTPPFECTVTEGG